jgi:hypothetical protein
VKEYCANPNCSEMIEVPNDYKPEYCCDGYMCGCMGYPINPIFCDECEQMYYGRPVEKHQVT